MLETTPKGMLGLVGGRVLILDPGRISREALKQLLTLMSFTVVGTGRSVAEAQKDGPFEQAPNLLIHNIGSEAEVEAALPAILEARARLPGAKSVVLMDCTRIAAIAAVMRAGVEAVLSKDISADVLQRSLELVLLDQRMFPAGVTEALMEPPPPASEAGRGGGEAAHPADARAATGRRPMLLSKREYQILRCLVDGMSNKLIARELDITEATVKVHIKGVLRKTRLSNRTQAAIWALNNSFWSNPPVLDGPEDSAAADAAPEPPDAARCSAETAGAHRAS